MKHIVDQRVANSYRGGPTPALCGEPDARTTHGPDKVCRTCAHKAGWSREQKSEIERNGPRRA
jgi:hypothetical protein